MEKPGEIYTGTCTLQQLIALALVATGAESFGEIPSDTIIIPVAYGGRHTITDENGSIIKPNKIINLGNMSLGFYATGTFKKFNWRSKRDNMLIVEKLECDDFQVTVIEREKAPAKEGEVVLRPCAYRRLLTRCQVELVLQE